jgi:hypothetical protein
VGSKPEVTARSISRARGSLADSYGAAVALVIFALVPYLALTSAATPLASIMGPQVGLGPQALQLTNGMANAGYAFGTVMAVQFALQRPALERWEGGEEPAWRSPPLAARLRHTNTAARPVSSRLGRPRADES